jgi:hypothetical protein
MVSTLSPQRNAVKRRKSHGDLVPSRSGGEAASRARTGRGRATARLLVGVGHILRRCYERGCSPIFDPDGDCMRL